MTFQTRTHCPRGHDTTRIGRYSNGECCECARARIRAYKHANRERLAEDRRLDRQLYAQVFAPATTGEN